ncbi:SMC-Nse1 multi-domain protein [Pyrenophora tritici-repentis]|nr:SMC-Nse1 multi-domain protein [Pyrenophora tritici-repentis]KAG9379290.1 SMC-Nse1 multi-domain protein [Pyrenophora tritici-repentis]KAI0574670.1 SMC-Nse1 multi-domain protein [Pyrenophora tritici-repentis]KAI0590289.1 SMC-Nse1 multi-domain protein [Pyrenophora tritici-repentis]KAI0614296.1 SMC-Nse1 multi-domain protein [Pyrenophora tritici-repentis]
MSRRESSFVRQPEDESYTWIHRAFLQAFQTHGILTLDEIKPILANIVTASNPNRPWTAADITLPFLTSTLQTINAKLLPLDYEIRWAKDQTPKPILHYALVNNASDPLTQQATRFSPTEIAYIRRLLDFMFDTNNTPIREVMAVSQVQAANLARPPRRPRQSAATVAEEGGEDQITPDAGLSMQEAEDILHRLVTSSFFSKSQKGYYTLAPRSLIELRSYLKETYNDEDTQRIRDCHGCKEIVTGERGQGEAVSEV